MLSFGEKDKKNTKNQRASVIFYIACPPTPLQNGFYGYGYGFHDSWDY